MSQSVLNFTRQLTYNAPLSPISAGHCTALCNIMIIHQTLIVHQQSGRSTINKTNQKQTIKTPPDSIYLNIIEKTQKCFLMLFKTHKGLNSTLWCTPPTLSAKLAAIFVQNLNNQFVEMVLNGFHWLQISMSQLLLVT